MHYIVTGCDGQLGDRVAENMIKEVAGTDLIFTCPDITRLPRHKIERWQKLGISIRQANYDNKKEMIKAFQGGDRIYFVSSIINGPKRVQQHKTLLMPVNNQVSSMSHILHF